MSIKKPLKFAWEGRGNGCILDGESLIIAAGMRSDDSMQIVRELNAIDYLLAACEESRDWATKMAREAGESGELSMREEFSLLASLLQGAINKAKGMA